MIALNLSRVVKRALIFTLAIAAAAATGWLGRKAYIVAKESMWIADASRFLQMKDLRDASQSLRRALQVNPASFEATRMMADLSESAGLPAAVSWRIRAAQLRPNEMTNRFAWAKTALRMQDLRSAANALDGVDAKGKTTAEYHKLGGALAWELNLPAEAEKEYTEALRLEPKDPAIVLNLATIHLSSTNVQVAGAARVTMEGIAQSPNPELRAPALHLLERDAEAHQSFTKAIEYSKEMLEIPPADFKDKIHHLTLLREAGSDQSSPWLASLKQEAAGSPAEAFLLGEWMAVAEGPTNALRWLRSLPAATQTNQPAPLIITDCQIGTKDWTSLLALVNSQDWGDMNYYRLAVESLAQRSLGHAAAGLTAWQKAVRLASRRLDCLSRLVRVTEAWRWPPEHVEVLNKIATTFPKEQWAVDQLVAQLCAQGDTRGIEKLLVGIQASSPSDPKLKNKLAAVLLLLNSDTEKACRLAKEAYDTAPADPFFASTYAYSLLMQKKTDQAAQAFAQVKPENLRIPAVAAYYGAIQAECGHKDIAKESLAVAETAKLLPEEQEMVRRAKARL
jgi:predicted Zn-dependent protease